MKISDLLKQGVKGNKQPERHPFKILDVTLNDGESTIIKFHATSRHSLMELTVEEIVSDPTLISGFHQKEALLLGFLSFKDLLLNEDRSIKEIKQECLNIINHMLKKEE